MALPFGTSGGSGGHSTGPTDPFVDGGTVAPGGKSMADDLPLRSDPPGWTEGFSPSSDGPTLPPPGSR